MLFIVGRTTPGTARARKIHAVAWSVRRHAILREGMRALLELEADLHVRGESANASDALAVVELLKPSSYGHRTPDARNRAHRQSAAAGHQSEDPGPDRAQFEEYIRRR